MVEKALFCKLRVYRAVPLPQNRVLELVRVGIEVGGISGYECLDNEHRGISPLLSENITQNRQVEKFNVDRELYEKSIEALEGAIWENGATDLRYLVADPYMEFGFWLSTVDVPNLRFEQAAGQSVWEELTSDLDLMK